MNELHLIAVAFYVIALAGLLVYGQNALALVWAHWRKRAAGGAPPPATDDLPVVTVQLPLYNERYVAARLLDAVASLDYPRERLEIQVLDDSTDDTPAIVAHVVATLKVRGLDVTHIRRRQRTGFKAGALSEGLARARGEYIAIFDADFVPPPDLLRRLLPSFGPDVACVQARWGHLNRRYSALTRAQAMTIDSHFAEQAARARGGVYTSFDGTAGIWRKAAIVDAGGWSAETLTEDLELSYRVQLRGWRIVQRPDVECAAELPVLVSALKIQQRRWAWGTTQTAVKLLLTVLATPLGPWKRYQACMHLTSWLIHPCALAAVVLTPVVFLQPGAWLGVLAGPVVVVGLLGPVAQAAYAQWILGTSWRRILLDLPAAVIVAAGLTYSTSLAVVAALVLRRPPDWARTPKFGIAGTAGTWRGKGYTQRAPWTTLVELALGAYCARSAWGLADSQIALAAVLFLFAIGFVTVGVLTVAQSLGIACESAGVATRVRAATDRSAAVHARAA